MEESKINEQLRLAAMDEVRKERSNLSPIEFIKMVGQRFIEKQLDFFPTLCDITRVQNKLKWDELKDSKPGRYTGSLGWSEGGEFKFDYEIPSELYLFMQNLVYKDFWSNDNAKVWRGFMKKILRGEDAMETLMWAKKMYGSNKQQNAVVGV